MIGMARALALLLLASCAIPDSSRVRDAIARLDHDDVEVRESAQRELEALGPPARPYLRSARDEAGSEEQRARLDEILWAIEIRSSIRIKAELRFESLLHLDIEGTRDAEVQWDVSVILDSAGRPLALLEEPMEECLPVLDPPLLLHRVLGGRRLSSRTPELSLVVGVVHLNFHDGRFASVPFRFHGVK